MTEHVVIVGGGFGGLTAAQSLRNADVRITLVDRSNHHLFQPLLYQVAMAGLSPAEIASPIRGILGAQENVEVLLGDVTSIDLKNQRVVLADGEVDYDELILATGAETSYFGHDAWAKFAPGLKSLSDAIEIRERVLLAFERAERAQREDDTKLMRRLLTFIVIGGGPTGVELAGAVAELARNVLAKDFRSIDLRNTTVLLIEAGERILPAFPPSLSQRAVEQLNELGVEVRTKTRVAGIDEAGVHIQGEAEPLAAENIVWGAGVRATSLAASLGVPFDKSGRVIVEPDLSLPGFPDVYAIGDMACFLGEDGKPLPGVSPVAMQQARCVAESIVRKMRGKTALKFHYIDKGTMATIGRSRAIAMAKGLRLSGFLAWMAWLLVHIWYLIGFRNRFVVLFNWAWSYFTYRRGARLITHVPKLEEIEARAPAQSTMTPPRREPSRPEMHS